MAERDLAQDGLELAERRRVLGRGSGDEAGPVAVAVEPDRQGPEEGARKPVEEGERELGEVGAVGHQEESGRARPRDGGHARRDDLAPAFEERVDRRAAVAGWRCRRRVEVDSRVAREVAVGDLRGKERMAAPGDDARGHLEEAFAAEEVGQGLVAVDAAAREAGRAVGRASQAFGAGGGGEPVARSAGRLSWNRAAAGARTVSAQGRLAVTRNTPLRPERTGSMASSAVWSSGRARLLAASALHDDGAEGGEAHAVRQALEQPLPGSGARGGRYRG